ncbi:protein S100-Z-like [Eucyclogobius newberryi]|uniref:protein S100-Z-like n=1 Tax=Eucyclogobius newberryi TaxID=166745 RepID=UPI003B58E4E4
MPKLAQGMATIKQVFDEYAKGDNQLSKAELSELLRKEFGMEPGQNAAADKMFNALDQDKSNSIDFKEFVTFVASLTLILNE